MSTVSKLNTCCDDKLELIVDHANGDIVESDFFLDNGVIGTQRKLFISNETAPIKVICYLRHNDYVYVVGNYCTSEIVNVDIDNGSLKRRWIQDQKLNAITCLKVLDRRNLLGIMDGKVYIFEKDKVPYELYADRNVECESLEYDSCLEFSLITASSLFDYLFRTRRPIVRVVRRSFDYTNGGPGRAIYVSRSLRNPEDVRRVFPPLLIYCSSSIRSSTLLPHTPEFSA